MEAPRIAYNSEQKQNEYVIPAPNTCHLLCDLQYALTIYTTWAPKDESGQSSGLIWQTKSGSTIINETLSYVAPNIQCWANKLYEIYSL